MLQSTGAAASTTATDPAEFTEMALFDCLPGDAQITRSQLRQHLLEMLHDNVPIVEIKVRRPIHGRGAGPAPAALNGAVILGQESISCGEVYVLCVDALVEQLRRRHSQGIIRTKVCRAAASMAKTSPVLRVVLIP